MTILRSDSEPLPLIEHSAGAPSPSLLSSPSPPSGGEGRGEGVSPRVIAWRGESCASGFPLPALPRKRGRERKRHALLTSLLALLAVALLSPALATAQAYPTHPVTIIVPFAAGGGNDVLARLLAQRMGAALGQNFVIENRPGAGGTTGARAVAKSPHDGYTLMVGHSGVFGVAPALYANAGYDPRKDFSPVGLIGSFQQILVVNPSLPIHTVADLIAAARREPGKLTYASAGVGSGAHLSTELFTAMAGIRLTHVPFRGSGATLTDLIAGRVDLTITTPPSVIGAVRAGQLRPIAVTGEARSALFPELPTFAEAGVPGYVSVIHYGMVAPAGLPGQIGDTLNGALNAALADPQVRARIADEGGEPRPGTREQQARDIDAEETKWGGLVRRLGIKVE
jgi:tripartite-type tricarboxylate transporter receptor subunit TctC